MISGERSRTEVAHEKEKKVKKKNDGNGVDLILSGWQESRSTW
jgi:hypothetical protein